MMKFLILVVALLSTVVAFDRTASRQPRSAMMSVRQQQGATKSDDDYAPTVAGDATSFGAARPLPCGLPSKPRQAAEEKLQSSSKAGSEVLFDRNIF